MFVLDKKLISERIKSVAAKNNCNYSDMAKKLGLNYHTFYAYVRIDDKKMTIPPVDVLANISLIFDVSIEWLIGLSEEGGVWR